MDKSDGSRGLHWWSMESGGRVQVLHLGFSVLFRTQVTCAPGLMEVRMCRQNTIDINKAELFKLYWYNVI